MYNIIDVHFRNVAVVWHVGQAHEVSVLQVSEGISKDQPFPRNFSDWPQR